MERRGDQLQNIQVKTFEADALQSRYVSDNSAPSGSSIAIRAHRLIRKLRGGAQPHLIEASDGTLYVVKFVNNPQHRRTLVNEWLSSVFLRYLHIHVPDTAAIQLTPEFIARSPDLYLSIGPRKEPVPPGLHFGSRFTVHPDHVAVFDFLPDKMLLTLENGPDFLGTLVFDKWVNNADSRQAIFFRAHRGTWSRPKNKRSVTARLVAQMIDHGLAFNGPHWSFHDSPIQGLYFRTAVYEGVRSLESFHPWLDMVRDFPVEVIASAWKGVPREWLENDGAALERLLEQLVKRRARTPELIEDLHRHRPAAFPNWPQR